MNKTEAVNFLHKSKGYSRRMSAKLVDIAMLQKSNSVIAFALNEAIEKARTKGAKDIQQRKRKMKSGIGIPISRNVAIKRINDGIWEATFDETHGHQEMRDISTGKRFTVFYK